MFKVAFKHGSTSEVAAESSNFMAGLNSAIRPTFMTLLVAVEI